ncbi:MAG: subtype I-B CRISPR-associated endonuclease Cas1 [Bacillus thermozeamaize]|uniref:CRISPR-associated endonuclease Cas1 n=1 Tax=Bacillus thermozeamaize TaxID=230954 RepID=A0A1Y3PMH2_9BACI|nr:MAG: subtype I-B CRISPR-associated endonuclease Cas1 [Bacillus thermozeamaize]
MKDYYIFSNGNLKRKDNTLYFVDSDGHSKPLPVAVADNIHIMGQVDLNTSLLNLVSQYGIRIHFYNYYGFYSGTFYPRPRNISGHTVIQQTAHYLDYGKRMYLARSFLQGGIHHMLRLLRRYKEKTAAYVDTILSEATKLEDAQTIQELMGIEGRIRQIYYQSFNNILNHGFVFEAREKRPPTDPLNALISFGNSLVYSAIVSEIYKTQLDPTISYLHEPSSKRFSLSLDLAEIFKPLIVDSVLISSINNRIINHKHFYSLDGMVLLNEEGQKRFITEWQKKLDTTIRHRTLKRNVSYRYFIRLECYKLIKHVIGDETYKPLKAWW